MLNGPRAIFRAFDCRIAVGTGKRFPSRVRSGTVGVPSLETAVKLLAPMTAAALFFAVPLEAQDQNIELVGTDWTVSCDERGCVVSRSMLQAETNRRFLTLTFALDADAGFAQMALFVPLGTAVQKPLTMLAGPIQREYAFTTCLADGCVILDQVAVDDVLNMSILPALDIEFYAVEADTPVNTSIPLTGLSEALDQVSATLGQ